MTIRSIWLGILSTVAVAAIIINTVVLSTLTDKYFKDYLTDNYDTHIEQIIGVSTKIMSDGGYTQKQIELQLETHLIDPIIHIELFDSSGILIAEAGEDAEQMHMMGGRMMPMMDAYTDDDHISQTIEISTGGETSAFLTVTSYSAVGDSIETRLFKANLLRNSLISIGVVIILAILTGFFISRLMSRDLKSTAKLAQDISIGKPAYIKETKISEINTIRQSLESLRDRLRLKSRSRKILTDGLIHQTRTPLTVLKTHIEGISDGLIEKNRDEFKILLQQVDDITEIISNMSDMIDAEKDFDSLKLEEFNPGVIVGKIVNSLRMQFAKKNISLSFRNNLKTTIKSDKHKLGQAIYNVLTNAYKFTGENGQVIVEGNMYDDYLVIEIRDNGIGMTEEETSKIFNAYHKGNPENSGEGLGLFIAQENIGRIKGDITVKSESGIGSTFTLRVPLIYYETENSKLSPSIDTK